jgi:hypothetical protein
MLKPKKSYPWGDTHVYKYEVDWDRYEDLAGIRLLFLRDKHTDFYANPEYVVVPKPTTTQADFLLSARRAQLLWVRQFRKHFSQAQWDREIRKPHESFLLKMTRLGGVLVLNSTILDSRRWPDAPNKAPFVSGGAR